jgi:hypothetical protein
MNRDFDLSVVVILRIRFNCSKLYQNIERCFNEFSATMCRSDGFDLKPFRVRAGVN